jgi:nitrous oxidase accessory protein NosD
LKGKERVGYYNKLTLAVGLAAAGATVGQVVIEDVKVTNATFGLGLHVFNGENSIVTVTDSEVESARTGIYSSINRSWSVSDNKFENCALYSILLETYGLSGGSSLIEDNLFVMNEGRFGIVGSEMKNVQVADNIFTGSSNSGILTYLGASWTIVDNDFCDLSAPSSISLLIPAYTNHLIS